jgi:hypothetical protein
MQKESATPSSLKKPPLTKPFKQFQLKVLDGIIPLTHSSEPLALCSR